MAARTPPLSPAHVSQPAIAQLRAGKGEPASLADFLPPTVLEIPAIEIGHLETLTPASVTQAKGLGEGGAIGPPAAIINAVNDALAPFGATINEIPATPRRIRAALRSVGA